jgi:hypothetical protein
MKVPCKDTTMWERGYRTRFESIRASIRSLQLDWEKTAPMRPCPQMKNLSDCIDNPWSALNAKPPESSRRRNSQGFLGSPQQLRELEQELDLLK